SECTGEIAQMAQLVGQPPRLDGANLAEVELLFTGWGSPVLDEVWLSQLPRLRAIFHGAGSIRDLVTEGVWDRGIVVSTCASINAQPVAEFALGAILLGLKRAWIHAGHIRQTRNYIPTNFSAIGAFESTIGLVSFGQSARKLCEHLARFDLKVVVY